MKNLLSISLSILGLFFISVNAQATEKHPWSTFKETVHTFHVSNGKFQNFSIDEQIEFVKASEELKIYFSNFEGKRAADKLQRIKLTEDIYTFVWNSKNVDTTIDENMTIPELPVSE